VDSEHELEVIKSEMEATRGSLASKIGELESTVRETVTSASESVTSTVDTVKDAVSNVVSGVESTVSNVKETFNLHHQFEKHPLEAMGLAIAAGFAGGLFLGGSRDSTIPAAVPAGSSPSYGPNLAPPSSYGAPLAPPAGPKEPGLIDHLLAKLQESLKIDEAVNGLKEMAFAQLTDMAKGLVEQVSPNAWNEGLSGLVKDLSTQLTAAANASPSGPQDHSAAPSFERGLAPEPDPAWTGPRAKPTGRVRNRR